MKQSEKNTMGTVVTLHIADDSKEFLDMWKIREILKNTLRFCSMKSI